MFTVNKMIFAKNLLIIATICMIWPRVNADSSSYIRKYEPDDRYGYNYLTNWNFLDFKVGPTSSNFYFLLNTTNDYGIPGRCAVIKENASGSKVWAKSYVHDNTTCGLLTIDRYEQFFYYSVKVRSNLALIMQMYCRTGEVVRQHNLELQQDSSIHSMIATSNYYYVYFIEKYGDNTWLGRFYAAGTTDSDTISLRDWIPQNIGGSMTEVHARNHSYVLYTTITNSTILGYVMLDWAQNDTAIWTLYYNCTRDD